MLDTDGLISRPCLISLH